MHSPRRTRSGRKPSHPERASANDAVVATLPTTQAPAAGAKDAEVTPEVRYRMIAERAYLKAERRGFQGGSSEQDWYEAEREVDAMIWLRKSLQ